MKIQFVLFLVAIVLSGCQADSARDEINAQNEADQLAKTQDLQGAAGIYKGKMHLISTKQDFDCVVTLNVVTETEKSTQPEAPSETVQIPKLKGNMAFPALKDLPLEDYPGFQSLLDPLDDLSPVRIDYGDFDTTSVGRLVLPYLGQDKTDFGSLEGTLNGDKFTGTWEADDFGNVGTFVLTRTQKTGDSQ
jgi:hypothetical protein